LEDSESASGTKPNVCKIGVGATGWSPFDRKTSHG
jgi:hypothetical protein